jgi:hypothetical protein
MRVLGRGAAIAAWFVILSSPPLTPSKTLIGIEKRAFKHFRDTDVGDPLLDQL